jgi:GNAT superfamily N-acetyltransferase
VSKFNRTKNLIKEYGLLGFLKKILQRGCSFVFWYRTLNFYGICDVPQTNLQSRCPLEIRKGGPENLALIVDLLDDIDEAAVRKRIKYLFDNESTMFLAFSEGKLVHIAWLHYYPGIRESYFSVRIKRDEAYISSCQTHPDYRGKNIYPVVLRYILRYAAATKKNRCFISSSPTNWASIRGIEKVGFFFVGKMRTFRLFGKIFNNQWVSSDTVSPD